MREWDVHYLWISTGCNFSILNGHSLSAAMLILGRQPNDYLLMLEWFVPREMWCRQYQTTMASWDMQGHMTDMILNNNRYIGVMSTEWTDMNQPSVRPRSLCLGEWDLGFICLERCRILSVRYMAKLLSCRSLYIWPQWSVVQISVLTFAAIVNPLHTRWVYESALSLGLGERNLFVDNWVQISSYPFSVSWIAIVSQYEHITLMT